ncbi:glycerate kinase [Kitasatospora aureofaciens]|uniref:Glycerate kinase n=1 Tax=Kitasatospora aureofaciens TaxID=1894 RepID=A0A1E7NDA6_KITAU|nr:glycerate kinase [Kitasatospora aureofaciens]QEU98893.1 glycerate kinase [Streptomyces viridifaciens]ARF77700.1 glycerate kinase [Kitasatospora aureofaciens]OEV38667.1 glycerate kinase [Kitasatospora aureofaciens]UKZ04902.1 glycerate kinase [Streptomyces viridifaciens]GGU74653.1 glycerate kinase [Kitasatospora aureofaciens]
MPPTPHQGHVVVAPDKFKGTLEGAEVAARIAAGIRRAAPGTEVRELPVADGGEGTLAAALAAGFDRVPAKVAGPTGLPVDAALAVRGDTAVVELAQASGLARLPGGRTAPLAAGSYGVGQLIGRAVSRGAKRIVLGLGGSACTDGGAGMVQALGVSLRDADDVELPPGGAALRRLERIELGPLAGLLTGVEVVVACDVDNPLLGPRGATAVYGPQKGADGDDLVVLEEGLTRFADQVAAVTGRDVRQAPGAGAAGGVGFAALALLGATMRPGIELLLELLGFDEAVRGARLVVTGEGCLDAQTLHGKAPAGVAAAAARAGVRVAAVAGRLELSEPEWRAAGFTAAIALTDLAEQPGDSMTRAGELAEVAGEQLAGALLPA